jgi:hypothetical protein
VGWASVFATPTLAHLTIPKAHFAFLPAFIVTCLVQSGGWTYGRDLVHRHCLPDLLSASWTLMQNNLTSFKMHHAMLRLGALWYECLALDMNDISMCAQRFCKFPCSGCFQAPPSPGSHLFLPDTSCV